MEQHKMLHRRQGINILSGKKAWQLSRNLMVSFQIIYFNEILEYLNLEPDYFRNEITDRFRSPHLWGKNEKGGWKLSHAVNCDSIDDSILSGNAQSLNLHLLLIMPPI